jgi:hypothetical protein
VLAHFFDRFDAADEAWLDEHAATIVGMVAADATEVHVAAYLKAIADERAGSAEAPPFSGRGVAVSLWHIAKAALVRDFAERVLQGEVPPNEPTPDTFSHWVASKLLTPEELERFEDQLEGERRGEE